MTSLLLFQIQSTDEKYTKAISLYRPLSERYKNAGYYIIMCEVGYSTAVLKCIRHN